MRRRWATRTRRSRRRSRCTTGRCSARSAARVERTSLTFVSRGRARGGVDRAVRPREDASSPVRQHAQRRARPTCVHNSYTPTIEVDPETYEVRADGELADVRAGARAAAGAALLPVLIAEERTYERAIAHLHAASAGAAARRLDGSTLRGALTLVLPFEQRQKARQRVRLDRRRGGRHSAAARHGAARRRPAARRGRHGRSRSSRRASRFRPSACRDLRRLAQRRLPPRQPPRRARDRRGLGALPRATTCSTRWSRGSALTSCITTSRSSPRAARTAATSTRMGTRTRTLTRSRTSTPCRMRTVSPSAAAAHARSRRMNASTFKLLQLVSPTLPVGAYAYSQGARAGARRGRRASTPRRRCAAGCATCSRLGSRASICRSCCACIAPGAGRDAARGAPLEPRARSTARDGRAAFEDLAMGSALAQLLVERRRGSPRARACRSRARSPSRAVALVDRAPRTPAPAMPGPGARTRSRPP